MNIKRIIREELDSGLQWIKDVKSNKDIAEELFSQTVITKDKGIVKLPFSWSRHQPKKPYFDLSIRKKYGEDKDSDDIWERYKVLVNNRLKEITGKGIKESNDLQWIKDVKPTLNDAFEQGTLKKGDVLTLSGELADCDAITTKEVNDFKIKITKLKKKINNSYFIPLQKKYWEHLEYEGKGDTRFYGSDGKMTIEDHHNNLNESNDLQWIRDIKPIPELKVGTCFIDVMDSTQTEWIIIDFKMTPGGTPIVVIKNKKNNTDIRYKHEGYFEEDLLSHRYKPCSNKLMESKLFK